MASWGLFGLLVARFAAIGSPEMPVAEEEVAVENADDVIRLIEALAFWNAFASGGSGDGEQRRVDLSRPVFFLAHTPQYIYTYVEISPTWSNKHNPPYRGVYEDVQQVVSVTVTNYCCAENRDSKVMLPTDFS